MAFPEREPSANAASRLLLLLPPPPWAWRARFSTEFGALRMRAGHDRLMTFGIRGPFVRRGVSRRVL
ncbi:hypothetical protein DIPPA_33151 [Diplonema papillatum]|nr:hypothetical protein DIPPA_33151 [Diplonema papillatum]